MGRVLISVQDVGFRYRKRRSFFRHEYYQALRAVSFDVYSGETLGIVGRNGCGKSTLLRLLAGVFKPDRGHIQRNGCTVSLLGLGVGFDPELSGLDNIILSAMLLGATKEEARANLEPVIEYSELGGFIREPVKTYSSGMSMRLGFAVAITIKPDVVMIDEALATGDAHFRQKAERTIVDKARSEQTMIMVSHNSRQMTELCDRVIWLEEGRIRRQGEPTKIIGDYERFAARTSGVGRDGS